MAAALASLVPLSAGAQEPDTIPANPRPTERPDTARLTAPDSIAPVEPLPERRAQTPGVATQTDTVPADTAAPEPPPSLHPIDAVGPPGWVAGVWQWDRPALERLPDLSLLQLLERVPGVVPVRTDLANQPQWAAVFGATAGAIRYVVDGFELDPLLAPTFDPARVPLLAIESVRVERRATGATVRIRTLSPSTPEPKSIVEAGTGDLDLNLFRGVFLAPRVLGGPLGLGFERLAADGFIPDGSSNHTAGWLKWSWIRGASGVQLEYRQSQLDRSGIEGGSTGSLVHWAVRARSVLGPVTGEVFAGGASAEETTGEQTVTEGTPHGGLRARAAFEAPVPVTAVAGLRFRDHPRLPTAELEAEVRMTPVRFLTLDATLREGWWSEGSGTGRWSARAVAGPFLGLTVVGELFRGSLLGDRPTFRFPAPDSGGLRVTRTGARLGAELSVGAARLGAAGLHISADTLHGVGLSPEPSASGAPGTSGSGIEVVAHLPTGWRPLSFAGWYVGMDAPEGWLYLPAHHGRAELRYHHLPLPSDNLEIFARLEHVYRGAMTAPAVGAAADAGAVPLTRVAAYQSTSFELSIRVVTVRAFIRWENILNRIGQEDLPGFQRPGQNVLYGVKWHFLN